MPAVNVRPGIESNSHDVSLSDGSETVGLIYADNTPRVLQEIPISDPARPFTAQQAGWTGGMGRLRYQDDPQGYHDSYAMWTMTDGKLMPTPQWKFGSGYRSCDSHMPGDVKLQSLKDAVYISVSFVASASYAADKALLWLDWEGAPGTLTLSLCPDDGGDPDLASALKTATLTVSGATRYGPNELDWMTTESLTATTTYHLVVTAADQNAANYWRVGVDVSGANSKTSADGSDWAAAGYTMYYRVVDADTKRQFYFFALYGATYAVSRNDDGSASKLYVNGDRGWITTGGASTTFSDSNSGVSAAWTVNEWAGYKVRILGGPADGQWRTIVSNTSTQITVDTAWGATLAVGNGYVIYDGPKLQEVDAASTGLGAITGPPAKLAASIVAFPQGQADPIRKISTDSTAANRHAYADDGTNYADLIATYQNPKAGLQVWTANNVSAALGYATATAWGAAMTFTSLTGKVGSASELITNMVAGSELHIMKEDSIWKMSDTYLPGLMDSGLQNAQDPSNGVCAFLSNGDLWFGWSHSIQKTEGSAIRDMLNYRLGSQGLKRGGVPKCGIGALGWKFFAMDSEGVAGTRSSIICFNGLGWQELFRGWKAGARIRNVYWQSNPGGRSKLWCDVNGELAYIDFPLYAANPLNDDSLSHQHYAEWVSSTFDGNDTTVSKLLSVARLIAEDDESGDWEIIVEWQADKDIGSDTWYKAGSLKNLANDEFTLDIGDVKEWRVRLRFYTEDADSPAILNSFAIDGWVFSPLKYQWVGTYKVSSNQYTIDGNEDFAPDTVLKFLKEAFVQGKSIRLRSMIESMDMKTVAVSAPLVSRDWVRTEDGKQKWGGTIQVALREA